MVRTVREIAAEEGVYELNRLTAAVNTADMDLKKPWSVAEYAEAEDAEQFTRLARNIGCFTFIEGATSYAEVGEFVTKHNGDFVVNPTAERKTRIVTSHRERSSGIFSRSGSNTNPPLFSFSAVGNSRQSF